MKKLAYVISAVMASGLSFQALAVENNLDFGGVFQGEAKNHKDNKSYVELSHYNNEVAVTQDGDFLDAGNRSKVVVEGHDNTLLDVNQNGTNLQALLEIKSGGSGYISNNNEVDIDQGGDDNSAKVEIIKSDHNKVGIDQLNAGQGNLAEVKIELLSDENTVNVTQHNDNNLVNVDILNHSDGNMVDIKQDFNGNIADVDIDWSDGNIVDIWQKGSDSASYVVINGSYGSGFNVANNEQTSQDYSKIMLSGNNNTATVNQK
jgi:hypothetical protein